MTDSAPIVGVVGCGVTGRRVVAHLIGAGHRVAVYDREPAATLGPQRQGAVAVGAFEDLFVSDLVVLCRPAPHASTVTELIEERVPVVSISDDLDDMRDLIALDQTARLHDTLVIAGAGMAPGLSGLLARWLSKQLHTLDELHLAVHGTAGPACARQHHHALGHRSLGWHDGEWIEPAGGTGRDLVWFPDPVAAHDCYRGALADPLVLQKAFPAVSRISARVSATRRDRFTARLPMLVPPHAAGGVGSVRVEARGAGPGGERVTVIAGAAAPAADLAAAVAATTAIAVLDRHPVTALAAGVHCPGDEALEGLDLLDQVTRLGVRVQEFTGLARATSW